MTVGTAAPSRSVVRCGSHPLPQLTAFQYSAGMEPPRIGQEAGADRRTGELAPATMPADTKGGGRCGVAAVVAAGLRPGRAGRRVPICLLYTSDAADDLLCVDLGGRRIIKKKKK